MSNSSLVTYTRISPNSTNPRRDTIKKITIHHMAGNLSVQTCGNVFAPELRQASANYGIDTDGNVGLYVEECNRAWTSASPANDNQAVTIEVANDEIGGDWHVSDTAYNKLIELCVDICRRNGIERLNYTGDTTGNLTRHNMFANTDCPGPYLQSRFDDIANTVNGILSVDVGSSASVTPVADELIPGYGSDPAAFIYAVSGASSQEDKVKAYQIAQTLDGYPLKVDGDFGTKCDKAAKDHVLTLNSRGHCVVFVQRLLGAKTDAWYYTDTRNRVKAWQHAEGLTVDGKVGKQSYRGLCLDSE